MNIYLSILPGNSDQMGSIGKLTGSSIYLPKPAMNPINHCSYCFKGISVSKFHVSPILSVNADVEAPEN